MRVERVVMRRIVAFGLLGLVTGAWLVARPGVVAAQPIAPLLEFPLGALVIGTLAWLAARPARAREPSEAPWRRHAQVVRTLADPEVSPLEDVLERWVATGADAHAAADVLARALDMDPARRTQARAELAARMIPLKSRRKRESLLRDIIETPEEPVAFDPVPVARPGA